MIRQALNFERSSGLFFYTDNKTGGYAETYPPDLFCSY